MGNCQAIDSASLAIQHPSGRVDRMYWPIAASEVMKMNPDYYVALLLTTTLYSSATEKTKVNNNTKNTPLRVTRIKLLRPTDTLILGHVYRLVTSQEVMKGVMAKKQGQMKHGKIVTEKISSEFEQAIRKNHEMEKMKQAKHERHRSRNNAPVVSKSKAWQPSLKSISEAGS